MMTRHKMSNIKGKMCWLETNENLKDLENLSLMEKGTEIEDEELKAHAVRTKKGRKRFKRQNISGKMLSTCEFQDDCGWF